MRSLGLLLLCAVWLIGCDALDVTREVEVTREVTVVVVTATPELEAEAEAGTEVGDIPVAPEADGLPEGVDPEQIFAANHVASLERGGVTVEVLRVIVADKEVAEEVLGIDFEPHVAFRGAETVVEVIFRVVNDSGQLVHVFPDQAQVLVDSQQVELAEWASTGGRIGDQLGGVILPGAEKIGGQWFGLDDVRAPEVDRMVISFDAPSTDNGDSIGERYYFEIDLSNKSWQPLPEELQ